MNNKKLKEIIELEIAEDSVSKNLLNLMLDNIGSLDAEIRDEVIFESFYYLLNENLLSDSNKQYILNYIMEHNLLYLDINKGNNNAVFTRTFTALLLVELLKNHYRYNWIKETYEIELIKMAIEYMLKEKDSRGKDKKYGWAHAFAHGADLLGTGAYSKEFDSKDARKALEVIDYALFEMGGFLYDEEGRLARASMNLIKSGKLDEKQLIEWINSKTDYINGLNEFIVVWKNYLMTLYFIFKNEDIMSKELEASISESISLFYHHFKRL